MGPSTWKMKPCLHSPEVGQNSMDSYGQQGKRRGMPEDAMRTDNLYDCKAGYQWQWSPRYGGSRTWTSVLAAWWRRSVLPGTSTLAHELKINMKGWKTWCPLLKICPKMVAHQGWRRLNMDVPNTMTKGSRLPVSCSKSMEVALWLTWHIPAVPIRNIIQESWVVTSVAVTVLKASLRLTWSNWT